MAWTHHNKPPMGWPLDLSEPINDGLVSYWYMPEGTGITVADLSRNRNTGTLLGGDVVWEAGKFGSALHFPATGGDYVSVADSPSMRFADGNFSVSIWVNADDFDSSIKEIIGTESNIGSSLGWVLKVQGNLSNEVRLELNDGGGSINVNSTTFLTTNRWYHIVVTVDGTNINVYVNGVWEASAAQGGKSAFEKDFGLGIGFVELTGRKWEGLIDLPMIYNRTLSASESALLHQFPFYGFLNPDEIPVLDQYYTVGAAGGIMTTNTGYWGAL